MRYTYKVPIAASLEFETGILRALRGKIAPAWLRYALILSRQAAIFGAFLAVTRDAEVALWLMILAWCLVIAWRWLENRITRLLTIRYLGRISNLEDWICEVADGRITFENRTVPHSFALAALSAVTEAEDFVCLSFGELARQRIPFAAFGTDTSSRRQKIDQFKALLRKAEPGGRPNAAEPPRESGRQ